jgi:hypothetical protein
MTSTSLRQIYRRQNPTTPTSLGKVMVAYPPHHLAPTNLHMHVWKGCQQVNCELAGGRVKCLTQRSSSAVLQACQEVVVCHTQRRMEGNIGSQCVTAAACGEFITTTATLRKYTKEAQYSYNQLMDVRFDPNYRDAQHLAINEPNISAPMASHTDRKDRASSRIGCCV